MKRNNSFSIIVITKNNTKNCIKTIENILWTNIQKFRNYNSLW